MMTRLWWQGDVNCFCETTASARLWLYLKRLYFISSAIAYWISPYASFYAGLSCLLYHSLSIESTVNACRRERTLDVNNVTASTITHNSGTSEGPSTCQQHSHPVCTPASTSEACKALGGWAAKEVAATLRRERCERLKSIGETLLAVGHTIRHPCR